MIRDSIYLTFSVHPILVCIPDSKVDGANMGPTWVLSAPDGSYVGHMNLAIWDMRPAPSVGIVLTTKQDFQSFF